MMPEKKNFVPAEIFPVAEYVRDEMVARKWDTPALASAMGVTLERLTSLLNGRAPTRLDCHCLAVAFGSCEQTWRNLARAEQAARERDE
jgi:plasmid maintenance system antidote protein VapI